MHSTQRRTTVDERIFSWTFLNYGKVHIPTRLVENPRNLCNQCWKENFSSSTAILATLVVPISCRHCRTFHTTRAVASSYCAICKAVIIKIRTCLLIQSSCLVTKNKRFGALILEAKGLAFFRSSQVQLLLPEYLDEALSSSCFFQNPSSQKYFHESYDWNQEIRGRA